MLLSETETEGPVDMVHIIMDRIGIQRPATRESQFNEIPGSNWLDLNCNAPSHTPFLYGLMCSSPVYITQQMATYALIFACLVITSVIIKRVSAATPGGRIYKYNQQKVHKILSDRRRRLRDLLNDPLLVRDMESRYGDLTSLRESVRQWEDDGFALQKKDDDVGVKVGGKLVVPWIKTMNIWLCIIFFVTFYCNANDVTLIILVMCFVHMIDNLLLQRAAMARVVGRGGRNDQSNKLESNNIVAAVGVPLPEADVGLPVEGIATV